MGFPFLALAAAGGGAALGVFGANKQNDAIEASSFAFQRAKNADIKNLRLNFFDTSRIASKGLQRGLGRLESQLFGNFASGQSLNRVIAAEVNDARQDQNARKFALERNVSNLEIQKQNSANQASSQTSSPVLAGIQGGISGFQMGSSLQSGFDSLGKAADQAGVLSNIESALASDPTNLEALAQLRAFTSGVPTDLIGAGGAIGNSIIQPFMQQMNSEAFQAGSLNNALAFQAAQTRAAQQTLLQSQNQFNAFESSIFGLSTFNPFSNPLLMWAR